MVDGSLVLFISFYFRLISKNWLGINIFSIVLSSLGTIWLFKNSFENPRYLISKGRMSNASLQLKRMASLNGTLIDYVQYT